MPLNLQETIKSAVEDGDVMGKIESAQGEFHDKVGEDTDTASKLPYASLPQGQDPNPFSIGSTKK